LSHFPFASPSCHPCHRELELPRLCHDNFLLPGCSAVPGTLPIASPRDSRTSPGTAHSSKTGVSRPSRRRARTGCATHRSAAAAARGTAP
jgi:hypothetical protein